MILAITDSFVYKTKRPFFGSFTFAIEFTLDPYINRTFYYWFDCKVNKPKKKKAAFYLSLSNNSSSLTLT